MESRTFVRCRNFRFQAFPLNSNKIIKGSPELFSCKILGVISGMHSFTTNKDHRLPMLEGETELHDSNLRVVIRIQPS